MRIVLYIEGLSNGRRFLRRSPGRRAVGKPLVVVKAAQRSRPPHDLLAYREPRRTLPPVQSGYVRVWRRAGRRARGGDQRRRHAAALASWLATRKRRCTDFWVGGRCGDRRGPMGDVGFSLPTLAPATQARLAAQLPAGQPLLPLDAGALRDGFTAAAVGDALTALAQDDLLGALIYQMTTQPQMANIASAIGDIGRSAGKPALLVLTAGSVADDTRAKLRRAGHFFSIASMTLFAYCARSQTMPCRRRSRVTLSKPWPWQRLTRLPDYPPARSSRPKR